MRIAQSGIMKKSVAAVLVVVLILAGTFGEGGADPGLLGLLVDGKHPSGTSNSSSKGTSDGKSNHVPATSTPKVDYDADYAREEAQVGVANIHVESY